MTAQQVSATAVPPEVAQEIALEQAHVDRVYAELHKAGDRVTLVEAEGLSRGRTDRTGDMRDEELTGLFERDALMYSAGKRRASLEQQYEGLVFGRLDLGEEQTPSAEREVRYIGRLGVRDDDYEPLVIDWRAPAAAPFYRATPVEPYGVVRRRVLRCRDSVVVGVEDDLMAPQAPEDLVVVGDGALMAALTRTRGAQMRDIVATIQRHQDEAIRAPARGITEITGGPGTGKTVVALHRAAYLLYSDRRRYESGGILVVGPSSSYTAYIERVLPSLGEDTVTLRSLGDIVEGMTADRLDAPEAAAIKGSLRMRRVLAAAARDLPPEAPTRFRAMIAGLPVHLNAEDLRAVRRQVLRHHQHNLGFQAAREALGEAGWAQVRSQSGGLEKADFLDRFADHLEVAAFLQEWWRQLDPREVLLWLAQPERLSSYAADILSAPEQRVLADSLLLTLESGAWSVADAALADEVSARLGRVQDAPKEESFYEIEELDSVAELGWAGAIGVDSGAAGESGGPHEPAGSERVASQPRERLLRGRFLRWGEYAHVLVDEAQDLSPMQWRMVGRRGRFASWTVVGDAAQSSWSDAAEAAAARDEAFGSKPRQQFRMGTNYRNAREIFDYAAEVVRRSVPDADIPEAVRETGHHPVVHEVAPTDLADQVELAVRELLSEVEGSIAVIAPQSRFDRLGEVASLDPDRVLLIDPMSTKGLEYDATVIVDPDQITATAPGGVRVLYVALTRAAHRMTVLRLPSRPDESPQERR